MTVILAVMIMDVHGVLKRIVACQLTMLIEIVLLLTITVAMLTVNSKELDVILVMIFQVVHGVQKLINVSILEVQVVLFPILAVITASVILVSVEVASGAKTLIFVYIKVLKRNVSQLIVVNLIARSIQLVTHVLQRKLKDVDGVQPLKLVKIRFNLHVH